MNRLAPLLLTVLTCSVWLSACGADDASPDDDRGERRAVVCNGAAAQGLMYLRERTDASDAFAAELKPIFAMLRTDQAGAFEKEAELYGDYADRLRDIDPPSRLVAQHETFVETIAEAVPLLKDMSYVVQINDESRIVRMTPKLTAVVQDVADQTNELVLAIDTSGPDVEQRHPGCPDHAKAKVEYLAVLGARTEQLSTAMGEIFQDAQRGDTKTGIQRSRAMLRLVKNDLRNAEPPAEWRKGAQRLIDMFDRLDAALVAISTASEAELPRESDRFSDVMTDFARAQSDLIHDRAD